MEQALLETINLTRSYGSADARTEALRGVSLRIEPKEFVTIMGASGSGKSTLLHILGLLDRPTSGDYFFAGQDTKKMTEEELARIRNEEIGFVFQAFHLLSRATVLDNVMLPLHYSTVPVSEHSKRARAALEQVDMSHRLHHRPDQLSGGERQRTAIARALVNNPRLVLADEPTGNLDSTNGIKVMEVIERLHADGHTIVVITHDPRAATYGDRKVELLDGTITAATLGTAHPHGYA